MHLIVESTLANQCCQFTRGCCTVTSLLRLSFPNLPASPRLSLHLEEGHGLSTLLCSQYLEAKELNTKGTGARTFCMLKVTLDEECSVMLQAPAIS